MLLGPWTASFSTPGNCPAAFPSGRGGTLLVWGTLGVRRAWVLYFKQWEDEVTVPLLKPAFWDRLSPLLTWFPAHRQPDLYSPSSLEEHCPLGADQLKRSGFTYSCLGSPASRHSEAQAWQIPPMCLEVLQLLMPPYYYGKHIHRWGDDIMNPQVLKQF